MEINMSKLTVAEAIQNGKTFLGIEFGSTRIKAVLTDYNHIPIASGFFDWENSLIDGIWTYSLDEVKKGLKDCFSSLKADIKDKYGIPFKTTAGIGISAMMHGYLVFDKNDKLLVPFRTWRNTITSESAKKLSALFKFNIPERWSIAHLYGAILKNEPHIKDIAFMTTLAGYIHYLLTGKKVLGVGDASGMFPIDSAAGTYNADMLTEFSSLDEVKKYPWNIEEIMPVVLYAGENAGTLTEEGAKLLDESGEFSAGIPFCPPEGDAGTGMVATDSVGVHTGNVSAGTSIFAMAVLDKELNSYYPEIDMVTTPDGKPVAMAHCNNCTGDLDSWIKLFGEALSMFGVTYKKYELYDKLLLSALNGDDDCGGLMNYNCLSGESMIGLTSGKPVFVKTQNSNFNVPNFIKTQLFSCLAALRIGMDILYREGVTLDSIAGHGGFFKTKETGARYMAAALNTPVRLLETAGEGGPWGIAVLAGYAVKRTDNEPLDSYLSKYVFADSETEITEVSEKEKKCFDAFLERYKKWLPIEETASHM